MNTDFIVAVLFGILGLIFGSFLNVVIYRFNTKKSLGGRSACMSCRSQLRFYELVPLFSYLGLRGRCRSCKTKISMQYPLVEAAAGLIFVLLFLKFKSLLFITPLIFLGTFTYYAFIFLVLLFISAYDIKHKIIPDELSLLFGLLSFVGVFLFSGFVFHPHMPSLWELSAGILVALPFALLFFASGGRWMGFGDAKLALGLGWLLGIANAFSSIFIACWVGSIIGIAMMFGKSKYNFQSELPFAPFLVLGAFLIFIFEWHMFLF